MFQEILDNILSNCRYKEMILKTILHKLEEIYDNNKGREAALEEIIKLIKYNNDNDIDNTFLYSYSQGLQNVINDVNELLGISSGYCTGIATVNSIIDTSVTSAISTLKAVESDPTKYSIYLGDKCCEECEECPEENV
jgi:hypothetical protein